MNRIISGWMKFNNEVGLIYVMLVRHCSFLFQIIAVQFQISPPTPPPPLFYLIVFSLPPIYLFYSFLALNLFLLHPLGRSPGRRQCCGSSSTPARGGRRVTHRRATTTTAAATAASCSTTRVWFERSVQGTELAQIMGIWGFLFIPWEQLLLFFVFVFVCLIVVFVLFLFFCCCFLFPGLLL